MERHGRSFFIVLLPLAPTLLSCSNPQVPYEWRELPSVFVAFLLISEFLCRETAVGIHHLFLRFMIVSLLLCYLFHSFRLFICRFYLFVYLSFLSACFLSDWYQFNDDRVERVSQEEAVDENFGGSSFAGYKVLHDHD